MKKTVFAFIILVISCFSVSASEVKQLQAVGDAGSFLGSREVLCTIDFAAGSTLLNKPARQTLSRCTPRIKQLDLVTKMIRIEGFASPEGNKEKNFRLSIDRARAVERYLRSEHGVTIDHYITGYGPTLPTDTTSAGARRVELAVYDNPWDQSAIPVEMSGGN